MASPAFEITFLGTSGGPVEGTTCSILVKSSNVDYQTLLDQDRTDEIICVDAGSGLSKLSEIIYSETKQQHNCSLLSLYHDSLPLSQYFNVSITKPFENLTTKSPFEIATNVFKLIENYLITHPHLDHISALAINTPNFDSNRTKQVYGSFDTLDALNDHVFNGIIWPNMQDFKVLHFNYVDFQQTLDINSNYTITMFKLSHGKLINNNGRHSSISFNSKTHPQFSSFNNYNTINYFSSAYLISNTKSQASLLIFGDFESDTISKINCNDIIWRQISPLIMSGNLRTIVLECSTPLQLDENHLYGHLTPYHLINELINLENYCKQLDNSRQYPLKGFNIIITHVKESDSGCDPRRQILQQLQDLNQQHNLHIQFSIALSGISVMV